MTASEFRDVVALDVLEDGQISSFNIKGTPIVLIRDGEQVHALGGKCPHKEAPLDQGAFCRNEGGGGVLVCPWHKAVFDVVDGALQEPVALDNLPRYPVNIIEGRVLVGTEPVSRVDPPARQAQESVLILGAGAAGVTAATTLRLHGFAGSITLVSEETELPYDRTALSKTVLVSDPDKAHAPPLRNKEFYENNRITRVTGHVVSFDPVSKIASLEGGQELRGDHVLIATGARIQRPDIPGVDMKNVFTLHREEDAEKIASILKPEHAITIIGGGFIGLEVASSLRQRGVGVTIVSRSAVPMEKQFGREVGLRLLQLHEENGVAFICDSMVAKIYGDQHAQGVELEDGMRLPSAFVLVGVGVKPETGYVRGLERDEDGAIVVDETMKAAPGVYAAGDSSALRHNGGLHRIEHWRHAQVQGRIAALSILGEAPSSIPTPWFWTQQFGKKIERLGWDEAFETVHLEGDLKGFSFLATYVAADGRPVALAGAGHAYDLARAAMDFDGFLAERG